MHFGLWVQSKPDLQEKAHDRPRLPSFIEHYSPKLIWTVSKNSIKGYTLLIIIGTHDLGYHDVIPNVENLIIDTSFNFYAP